MESLGGGQLDPDGSVHGVPGGRQLEPDGTAHGALGGQFLIAACLYYPVVLHHPAFHGLEFYSLYPDSVQDGQQGHTNICNNGFP